MTKEHKTSDVCRHAELASYGLVGTSSAPEYSDITELAAFICATPLGGIALVDDEREWFLATTGGEFPVVPKEIAFCVHTVNEPEMLVVSDTHRDHRFAENPLVIGPPGIRFYAGIPLRDSQGFALGALCVGDTKPRRLRPEQITALKQLARQTMTLFALRKTQRVMTQMLDEVERRGSVLSTIHEAARRLIGLHDEVRILAELAQSAVALVAESGQIPARAIALALRDDSVSVVADVNAPHEASTRGKTWSIRGDQGIGKLVGQLQGGLLLDRELAGELNQLLFDGTQNDSRVEYIPLTVEGSMHGLLAVVRDSSEHSIETISRLESLMSIGELALGSL